MNEKVVELTIFKTLTLVYPYSLILSLYIPSRDQLTKITNEYRFTKYGTIKI